MDFFDELLDKARVAFDVAVKATEDVVDTGKQKFNIASLESKISKDYKTLGEAFYAFKKNGEIDDAAVDELILSIDEKLLKIEEIKEEIRNSKADRVCANCGAAIEENTIFCPFCGQKLEFTSEEE